MKALAIAHRGLHNEYVENTVEAFKAAVEGKYYGIETDIHLTADNKWVIHHDATFKSDDKEYKIEELTLEEIKKLPLDNPYGIKDVYCPSLEEYLEIVSKSDKRPIIEIKPDNPSFRQLRKLVKLIRNYFDFDKFTIIAFYPWPLVKLRMTYHKKIHLQQLIGDQQTESLYKIATAFKMDIDVDENILTRFMIEDTHARGKKVNVWTVDSKEHLRKFESLDVDYITTNKLNQDD